MVRTKRLRIPLRYLEENWGAPFIALFILLLMVAAIFFLMGLVSMADNMAIYAYYVLIVGVVLQLICFIKYHKRRNETSATY
jgi:amino acid transporter